MQVRTSTLKTAQINCVVCSQLTVMKFWVDKSTSREPKLVVYLLGGLFVLLLIGTTGC